MIRPACSISRCMRFSLWDVCGKLVRIMLIWSVALSQHQHRWPANRPDYKRNCRLWCVPKVLVWYLKMKINHSKVYLFWRLFHNNLLWPKSVKKNRPCHQFDGDSIVYPRYPFNFGQSPGFVYFIFIHQRPVFDTLWTSQLRHTFWQKCGTQKHL